MADRCRTRSRRSCSGIRCGSSTGSKSSRCTSSARSTSRSGTSPPKRPDLPLYQLLGGYRDEIPAYASTVTFATTEEFLEVADQCLAYGFRAIKLHAWGDARRDAQLCQDLRKHVGDEIALMYDGSAGFNPYDALYVGRACEEAGYYWYEEPMREFSIGAYRRLCDDLRVPVLSAETSDGAHYNAADFILHGAADMLRTSVHYKGGFTGGLRVAHLADAFQMNAEVHGNGLDNLQLGLAIRNNSFYESFIPCNPIEADPLVERAASCVRLPRPASAGRSTSPSSNAPQPRRFSRSAGLVCLVDAPVNANVLHYDASSALPSIV